MKSLKKILILCDAHDCIRHEETNKLLLKQLYVVVFLLKRYFGTDDYTLHINNRAIIGFEVFWKKESSFYHFFFDHIIQKPWNDINMLDYDLVISHPDYQNELQRHFLKEFAIESSSKIYSLLELQYTCDMIYNNAGKLFTKGGLLEIDRNTENETALVAFKQDFDQSINRFTVYEQEAKILNLAHLITKCNSRIQVDKINNVLILDDYKRAFFIGDSVHWLEKIKKLIDIFREGCCVHINVTNKKAFDNISKVFQKSLPESIVFTNYGWGEIDLEEYDVILCNNDVLLKFYWYINQYSKTVLDKVLLYSFTAMDERPITEQSTMDFYSNIFHSNSNYKYKLEQADVKRKENIFKEITLLTEEHDWASNWLINNGVLETEKLIVLLYSASSIDKIIYDAELLKLIKWMSGISDGIKILLINEKIISDNIWLNEAISSKEYNKVVVAEALELRNVMSLLGNKQVAAVIGPCTGLMHLADGIYSYLLNHKIISQSECPLLLTCAGKQAPERNYHPNNWWKNANLVKCCVYIDMKGEKEKRLILLDDCPPDFETFNNVSISAREISCDMLLKFIYDEFPNFIKRLGVSNFDSQKWLVNSISSFQNLSATQKIPTFIINLKQRVERRSHILRQFSKRTIFDWTLVEAIENENGRLGLWQTIKKIVSKNIVSKYEYILICEDDHQFTEYYSDQKLLSCINESAILKADILLGGIGFCNNKIQQVHNNLVSVDQFACTQFMVIFRSFFEKILNAQFTEDDCADWKMAELSNKKLVIYPFISTQKDFGYSDVSSEYYENKMSDYFNETSKLIQNTMKYGIRHNNASG